MAEIIPWTALLWCLLPVLFVGLMFYRWQGSVFELVLANGRMFVQLLLVGYVLVFLFARPSIGMSLIIVAVMLLIANWIAIRPVRHIPGLFSPALIALAVAVLLHLALTLALIISPTPWYQPQVVIPLAGMYLANTMNAISLSSERFYSEVNHGNGLKDARNTAFQAAMIPQINGLLAVGVVALPGMMTGQILSGVSPLIAVRYQIVIMTMLLGATGMGCTIMLTLLSKKYQRPHG